MLYGADAHNALSSRLFRSGVECISLQVEILSFAQLFGFIGYFQFTFKFVL
jgi:hypothetical protein